MPKVNHSMFVVKRDGTKEKIYFDKITARNLKLASDLDINPEELSRDVIVGLNDGITTREIDILSCETALAKSVYEPEYSTLAIRIAVNDLHKSTPTTFREYLAEAQFLFKPEVWKFATDNIDILESTIDHTRDHKFSYFGFKTLERSYLLRNQTKTRIIERPQYLYMRVALGIHTPFYPSDTPEACLANTLKCYKKLSTFKLSHASPTLFNSGLRNGQLGSCFLLTCPDSIDGIANCWRQCSFISKYSGGIGFDITAVRGKGSLISGNNGVSNGICPFIKIFDSISRAVNQGGKREGKIAIYIQPWHVDIEEILTIRKNTTPEELRSLDIHVGLWMPDIFLKRIEQCITEPDTKWSLFCSKEYPELITLYGQDFEDRYLELESQEKFKRQLNMHSLWIEITNIISETGEPYMMSKDNVNRRNNQADINDKTKRPITCSNLCTEIVEWQNSDSIASCNLASIGLSEHCVVDTNSDSYTFDFEELRDTVDMATINLNRIIDINFNPLPEIKANNQNLRPIGIGIQGLADVFIKLNLPWVNSEGGVHPQTLQLNQSISEHIYYTGLETSCRLAQIHGKYSQFDTSPLSTGKFQWQLDDTCVQPLTGDNINNTLTALDWDTLRTNIVKHGVFNSLICSMMPTVSSAQLLNNYECFEPITSNLFLRQTKSGHFPIVNNYLYRDLSKIGLWTTDIVNQIIEYNGSIQAITQIPLHLKLKYKTVWEIKQNVIIKMAHARSGFVDQASSMNIYMEQPTTGKLTSLYLDCWKRGLKTFSYYLRTKPSSQAIKFSLLKNEGKKIETKIINGKEWTCEDGSCCSG